MRTGPPDELLKTVNDALDSQDAGAWRAVLRRPVTDGFGAVMHPTINARLFPAGAVDSFDKWITNIAEWRKAIQDPRNPVSIQSTVLHELWDSFASRLSGNLHRARIEADIPQHGGVLAFVAGLSRCIVLRYHFSAQTKEPILEPISVIDHPKTVFDLWSAIDQATPRARNALKTILATGHKLVAHRDILVHVDRRREERVFGPSIDTLLMAEALAQGIYETYVMPGASASIAPRNALGVGCGSGFIAAGMIRHLSSLVELFAVDIEHDSVSCTNKNLKIAVSAPGAASRAIIRLLTGPFESSVLNRRFDLVVCNPPYIPVPPVGELTDSGLLDYVRAVGGLDLLQLVTRDAEKLLTAQGQLLLMTSSVSAGAALDSLHGNLSVDRPLGQDGYEAVFDVEAVLERPAWLSFLMDGRGLTERNGVYYHRLHPLWVRRRGQS